MPRMPNLLIIGAMKCGTTSLHNYLNFHPDISMSTPKEINYFTQNYSKSVEWYKSHFSEKTKIAGESSQNYTKIHDKRFSEAAGRIKDDLPDVKLIYIIRDPIQRIVSHIHENIEDGLVNVNEDFDKILLNNSDHHWIMCSMYDFQMEAYLKSFSKNNVRILTLESLKDNTSMIMNRIFEFLEVDVSYEFDYQAHNTFNHKSRVNPFYKKLEIFRPLKNISKNLIGNKNTDKFKKSFLYQKISRSKFNAITLKKDTKDHLELILRQRYLKFLEEMKGSGILLPTK